MQLSIVVSRIYYTLTRRWTLPIQQLVEAALLAKTPHERVLGFDVYLDAQGESTANAMMQLGDALRLVERSDPRCFARLRCDLTRFVISPAANVSAAHFPTSSTCYLSSRFVEEYPVPNVAIAIVHEATHARLDHAGIPLYPDWKARIERRCVLEEITFAQRLSETEHPGISNWISGRIQNLAAR